MGQLTIWQFGLRVLVLYVLVMVALRVMGKREIGQLSVFDFVVSVMIAELSTVPMEDTNVPMVRSILAIGLLVALQVLVAIVSIKSHKIRHIIEGEPSVLIEHGQIRESEMRKTRYSVHDLLTQLREKGFANIADVEFAILETSGKLSVFPSADKRPITPSDVRLSVQPENIPMPVIIDGKPVQKTLDILGKDEDWLFQEVRRRGFASIRDVFFADAGESGVLYFDPYDNQSRAQSGRSTPDTGSAGRTSGGSRSSGTPGSGPGGASDQASDSKRHERDEH